MLHQILWILMGCGVLSMVVLLWFLLYYLFTPHIDHPDARAKITGPCGDTMEIRLKFEGDRVVETSSWTDGCVHSMNSVWAAADLARGKTTDEIREIDAEAIKEFVGGLPCDHLHCALLAEKTLQAALNNHTQTAFAATSPNTRQGRFRRLS